MCVRVRVRVRVSVSVCVCVCVGESVCVCLSLYLRECVVCVRVWKREKAHARARDVLPGLVEEKKMFVK